MSIAVYINWRNERLRVHCSNCNELFKHGKLKSGKNRDYRDFYDYDDAWQWINNEDNIDDDFDCADCPYCDPEEC